jgi:hypothetical protein
VNFKRIIEASKLIKLEYNAHEKQLHIVQILTEMQKKKHTLLHQTSSRVSELYSLVGTEFLPSHRSLCQLNSQQNL